MEMAHGLMAVMAAETSKIFSPSKIELRAIKDAKPKKDGKLPKKYYGLSMRKLWN